MLPAEQERSFASTDDGAGLRRRHPTADPPRDSSPTPAATADGKTWSVQLAQARRAMAERVDQQQKDDGWVLTDPSEGDILRPTDSNAEEAEGREHHRRASVASSEDEDEYVAHLLGATAAKPAVADIAEEPTDPADNGETATAPEDAPMCRICFSGPDEDDLGKLFSPCMCRGTSRFVHQACLEGWRKASQNQRSFYACDLCNYKYKFRRTTAARVVTSKITVGLLTSWVFLFLVFVAGFVANSLISIVEARSAMVQNTILSELFVADHVLLGEGIRDAVSFVGHQLEESSWVNAGDIAQAQSVKAVETDEDEEPSAYRFVNPTAGKKKKQPPAQPSLVVRAIMHFTKGSAMLGLLSVFYTYVAATFVSPLGRTLFRAIRPVGNRRRNDNTTSMSQVVVLVLIVFGVIRSIRQVYRGVRWGAKQVLSRVEDLVLDVSA
ncbi:hypothetical protein JCM10207_004940 [Rhodosporidiobolus poonsookiae]